MKIISLSCLWFLRVGGTDKSTGNHNINNTTQEECYKAYEKALQWALND